MTENNKDELTMAARARKPAPNVVVRETVQADDRLRYEMEMDKANPAYKHMWAEAENRNGWIESNNLEVAHQDGKEVRFGGDILCRKPKEQWDARINAEHEASMSTMKNIVKENEDMFVKTATPVKPRIKKK